MEKISVCIPAYNEETTILNCIKSILNQKKINIDEILVGVNGSTDKTIYIVQRLQENDKRIKIINSPKGKANAWNYMNRNASNNIRVFIDGDCFLEELSIYNLLNDLQDKVMVGGTLNYLTNNVGVLGKIIHYPNKLYPEKFDLCGALYIINFEKLLQRMNSVGYKEMPTDIIADDRWLVLVSEEVDISRKSNVYTNACNIKDQIKRVKRMIISDRQLIEEHNDLYQNMYKFNRNKRKLKKAELKSMSILQIIIYSLVFIPKKIINIYIDIQVLKSIDSNYDGQYVWEHISSSRLKN